MATSGQTLNDRINAARYALAGQGLARCVCKATTEEVIGPKKKHLDYLLACTHEPNVSIPQLANLLIERTNHIYWVVVFKALVTVHHLMSYGNERFIQYLASSNYSFELSTFLDKTSVRDFSMSTFIRRYSRYINEKALSYRLLAFDFCKVKRGNEGVLRTMPIDRLLKTLPILQNQLDALLEFDCGASDLNNGVINACFMLLFRDLIGLFACHNDGIINLLNKYFTLNKKLCREAFDLYKKFLVRMDKVSEFLRVAEVVGIDKDEIPDLRRAPSSLIDALEHHLQNLESNKKILKQLPSNSKTSGDASAAQNILGSLTPPNSSARSASPGSSSADLTGTARSPSISKTSPPTSSKATSEEDPSSFKEDEVRKALEEEARVLSQYGSTERSKSSASKTKVKTSAISKFDQDNLRFAVNTEPKTIDDIFGDVDAFANGHSTGKPDGVTASDNLSNSSSASSAANSKHNRPDFDSIKSAIQSATTTLEKANNSNNTSDLKASSTKKASDDLLSLLDPIPNPAETTISSGTGGNIGGTNIISNNPKTNPVSLYNTSPFDMSANGHTSQLNPTVRSGNPFPDINSTFSSAFTPTGPTTSGSTNVPPMMSGGNSIFRSQVPTSTSGVTPNYTNLGGLEGFGSVLQPMSTPGSNSTGTSGGKLTLGNSSGVLSQNNKVYKGDLDSALRILAQDLKLDGIGKTKK